MNTLTAAAAALAFILAATGSIAVAVVLFGLAMLLILAAPYTQTI